MSQSWEEYVAGLTPAQRDHMLHELLKWRIEDLGVDGDVKFIAHDDPDGGAGPDGEAVSDIFWVTCGESLVPAPDAAMAVMSKMQFIYPCQRVPGGLAELPGDNIEPSEPETTVATVNQVRIMVNTAKGIGLLCRSVQLVSTPTHHHFKSTVIFNQLTGPSAVINSFIESLQSPKGRQSVLMNCAAGLLRVLENVKAAEVSMSVASGDITIIERVTAVSTTKLELPANHDH